MYDMYCVACEMKTVVRDENTKVTAFLTRLIESPSVGPNTQIIFGIESNYGGEARATDLYVQITEWARKKHINIHAASNDNHNNNRRPGIWLTERGKEAMALRTRQLLDANRLHFSTDVTSSQDPAAMINKLLHQAGNYRRKFRDGGVSGSEASGSNGYRSIMDTKHPFYYTGKGSGENDDLIVTLQEAVGLMDDILRTYPTVLTTLPIQTDEGVTVEFSDSWLASELPPGARLGGVGSVQRPVSTADDY